MSAQQVGAFGAILPSDVAARTTSVSIMTAPSTRWPKLRIVPCQRMQG
jgi:hypothetical protein